MPERDIFLAAIDIPDLAARAAYLDAACAGDAGLRARVEGLLHSHEGAGSFLARPAVEQLAADPEATETDDRPERTRDLGAPTLDATPRAVGVGDGLEFLQPSDRPDSLGRLGHYEVLEVVGRGGMGAVLRAFDPKLHRVVAVKVMAPDLAAGGAARQRFIREARAAAAVSHEHVVAIHAIEEEHRPPYIVMQLVDGVSLQEKLERQGALETREVLRIGYQIAEGLAAAHKQGLVHRDIKPANILLENGVERVKITDFGLARAVDDASVSQSGIIAGTPMYMSPEQAQGEPVDHRSDLFSLGSVLYAMCAGRAPFRASGTMAVLRRVAEEEPTPLREVNPDVPEWLEAIIAKLHAKKRADRFQSARAVADALSEGLARLQASPDGRGRGSAAPHEKRPAAAGPSPVAGTPAAAPRARALVLVALIPVAAAGVFAVIYYANRDRRPDTCEVSLEWVDDEGRSPVSIVIEDDLGRRVKAFGHGPDLEAPRLQYPADARKLRFYEARFRLERGDYRVRLLGPDGHDLVEPSPLQTAYGDQVTRWLTPDFRKALAQLPAPAPHQKADPGRARTIANWGEVIDPDGVGTFDEVDGRLRITAPAGWHDLSAYFRVFNAPRVVREVSGDFRARVRVRPFRDAEAKVPESGDAAPFLSAGLVLWKDEKNFARIDRRTRADQSEARGLYNDVTYFRPDVRMDTPLPADFRKVDPKAPSHFELERRGQALTVRSSIDGNSWSNPIELPPMDLPATVKVGVAVVTSTTRAPLTVEFEGLEISELPPDPAELKRLHEVIGVKERALREVKERYNAGQVSRQPLAAAEAELLEARADLAGVEGPPARLVRLLEALVAKRQEQLKLAEARVKAGVALPSSLDEFRALVWRAESRLAPAKARAPVPAVAPFDAAKARAHQEAWAKYLGVPAEFTNSVGMKLRLIPPGEFTMGTPAGEASALAERARRAKVLPGEVANIQAEPRPHAVRLTQPFYLGVHEVTYEQFARFVKATGHRTEVERNGLGGWSNAGRQWVRRPEFVWRTPGEWTPDPDEPAVHIGWEDANAFCDWLGREERRAYALPAEAQWEFACRAGTTGDGPWAGGETRADYAWTSELLPADLKLHRPRRVGFKKANAFGLHDVLGNAWELCADWYAPGPAGGEARTDPEGPPHGEARVIRGGAWYRSGWLFARSSARGSVAAGASDAGVGFRVALVGDLVPPLAELLPAPREAKE